MTDEELTAFLRDLPFLRAAEAADRIEALTVERDELAAAKWNKQHADTMNDIVLMGLARDATTARAEELEAKLAECLERNALLEARLGKAVEALRDVHVFGVITHTALAVLAEIESSEAAPPYGLEGEKT